MPNRILKESICESYGLSECSIFARDLYQRLITYADDYGRFNADTQIMRARLYPLELDCVTQDDVNDALVELCGVEKVSFYTSQPRKSIYGCLPTWAAHQRVRDSKSKHPDPDDTTINDWYLQRFIPMDLKIEIIERDGFKCQICGKFITSDRDAKRLAKHGNGMYHIDHIVPVIQGGRATHENLRLSCPSCNMKRKKTYSIKEILKIQQPAASCGNSPHSAANCRRNPIQSESNPNPNANADMCAREGKSFTLFWEEYPKKCKREEAWAAWKALNPDPAMVEKIMDHLRAWKQSDRWAELNGKFIPNACNFLAPGGEYLVNIPAPAKQSVPQGASGVLGEAEMEAIQRVLAEDSL